MTATEQWIFLCAAHKTPKEVWIYFGKLTTVMQEFSFTVHMIMGNLLEVASSQRDSLYGLRISLELFFFAILRCCTEEQKEAKELLYYIIISGFAHSPFLSGLVLSLPETQWKKAVCVTDRRVHAENRTLALIHSVGLTLQM